MEYDLTLINVPYLSKGGEVMEPIGLTYLGAYLKSKNYKIKGFDFSYSDLSAQALVEKYRLDTFQRVGLSFYNTNAVIAFELAKEIKRRNKDSIIIAGGPHASALYKSIFIDHPEIDFVVRNEGELVTEQLLRAFNNEIPFSEVKGISYHIEQEIHVNPESKRVDNLDELPAPIFEFDGNEMEFNHVYYDKIEKKLKTSLGFVTSRSCPYKCSFCAIILIGREWRYCTADKIVDDLRRIEKAHNKTYTHLYFLDANFFVRVKRAVEVAKALKAYNPEITFSFSTRSNQVVKAKDYFPELVQLGLRAVEIGIESGSEDALKRFGKDTKLAHNYEAVEILQENRLELFLDFIMFDPECEISDLKKNLRFLMDLNLDTLIPWDHLYNYMTPYLGTEIRKRYQTTLKNVVFQDDILPTAEEMFLDNKVRQIYIEFQKFDRLTNRLQEIIQDFEKVEIGFDAQIAILKLNIISIKRLPFVILQRLINLAEAQKKICLENAIPNYYNSRNERVDLSSFLDYTQKEIAKYSFIKQEVN